MGKINLTYKQYIYIDMCVCVCVCSYINICSNGHAYVHVNSACIQSKLKV